MKTPLQVAPEETTVNSWVLFDRKYTSGSRPSQFAEWVCIYAAGIRFSRPALEKWFGENKFVEFYIDKENDRIAIKSFPEATLDSYKISPQGDRDNPNFHVMARAPITYWRKGLKGRHHCSLRAIENGMIELIPEERQLR